VDGAAGSVSTLAPMRAMEACVALSTLDDFLLPNSLRRSLMDWKNDDAADVRRDLSGSSRVTDADRGAWVGSGRPGPREVPPAARAPASLVLVVSDVPAAPRFDGSYG